MISYSKHPAIAAAMVEATKRANAPPPSVISQVLHHPAFLAPLAMMGVGAAVGGAQSFVTKLLDAKKKNETFRGMLDLNPTLKKQDQTTVKRVFNSLHAANPHFMNDPMVAGALVHNTIEAQGAYGMDQPMVALAKQVSELSQGRASIVSAMEKEKKMRSSWAEPAREAVRGGFEAAADVRAEMKADPMRALEKAKQEFHDEKARFQMARDTAAHQEKMREADARYQGLEEAHGALSKKVENLRTHAGNIFDRLADIQARHPGFGPMASPMQQTSFQFGPHVHHRARSSPTPASTPVSQGSSSTPVDAAQLLIEAAGLNRTQGR